MCQQASPQFVSPYCITVLVPANLSTVFVTIMHYIVCTSKAPYSSCHHIALQCVCQQSSLQFLSPYSFTVCVQETLSTFRVKIFLHRLCTSRAHCISCHHTPLQCVCQQTSLLFVSPYCIIVCVTVRLSRFPVNIMHYSVCAGKALCSSSHHSAVRSVCQQGCLNFVSRYCITVCVPARLSIFPVTKLHYILCLPAKLSTVCVTKVHYILCASEAF